MTVIASVLLLALTRAEIIERFKTPPVTHCDGLVQVFADCPADMRREYQVPVASYVSDICDTLYKTLMIKPRQFKEPGIIVHIGSVRTNVTDVISTVDRRAGNGRFTRIRLPAPAYSDMEALRIATAKAFFLSVAGEEIDDATAVSRLRLTDPVLRVADERSDLARWRDEGVFSSGKDDEFYLMQQRKVLMPGKASREDVLTFASRLRLYPDYYGTPFCGRYSSLSFDEAIDASQDDMIVRLAAVRKVSELLLYGGGRGDKMNLAVQAYGYFLTEVAKGEKTPDDLRNMLSAAEQKLKDVENENSTDDNR